MFGHISKEELARTSLLANHLDASWEEASQLYHIILKSSESAIHMRHLDKAFDWEFRNNVDLPGSFSDLPISSIWKLSRRDGLTQNAMLAMRYTGLRPEHAEVFYWTNHKRKLPMEGNIEVSLSKYLDHKLAKSRRELRTMMERYDHPLQILRRVNQARHQQKQKRRKACIRWGMGLGIPSLAVTSLVIAMVNNAFGIRDQLGFKAYSSAADKTELSNLAQKCTAGYLYLPTDANGTLRYDAADYSSELLEKQLAELAALSGDSCTRIHVVFRDRPEPLNCWKHNLPSTGINMTQRYFDSIASYIDGASLSTTCLYHDMDWTKTGEVAQGTMRDRVATFQRQCGRIIRFGRDRAMNMIPERVREKMVAHNVREFSTTHQDWCIPRLKTVRHISLTQ